MFKGSLFVNKILLLETNKTLCTFVGEYMILCGERLSGLPLYIRVQCHKGR